MRVIQCKANADYDFKVGAPGRVNIIGEHIDYCGFSVLPMAIQQSCTIFGKFINFAKESEDRIVIDLQNAQSRAKGRVFEIIRGHFDVDLSEFHWTNYVVCGIKGILEYLSELQGFEFSKGISCRIKLWVDGNIPQGAGLSSSSALVVASALAMLCISNKIFGIGHVNEIISDNQLAQVCAKSERFVGTEGGG
jgi:galactokinase